DPKQPDLRRNGPATTLVDEQMLDSAQWTSGLVFTVPAGSTVNLQGDEQNGFVYAEFMWMYGWIDAGQIDAAERIRDERVPEDATPVDTRTPKPGAGTAWTTVDLSLRAGPSAAENAVAVVPAGTRIDLTGVMQNDFQRVVYQDQVGWLSNEYLELPADPEPEVNANGRPEWTEREIIRIIEQAADKYGQSREDMLRVARCESLLDPYAVNPSGSYGLFQFVRSTWESTPYADKDIFDPVANANAAGWMWQQGRRSEWVCH
ncbi:MAG: transglycosylase SLT domain-containing protein, partial [Thermomicrobiales bacterium]